MRVIIKLINKFVQRILRAKRFIERQFASKKYLQPLISLGYILLVVAYVLSATKATLASGSWNQTDWSGGSGASTSSQYSAASNIDATTTAGKFQLAKTEKLTNGSLDVDASSWSTNYLYGTPSLVQLKSAKNNLTTSVTATLPSAPTPGNTLFLAYSTHGLSGAITAPAGFTIDYEYKSDYLSGKVMIFRKVAGASEPSSITITTANNQYATLDVYEFNGISTVLPLDRTSNGTNTVAANGVSINPTPATSQVNELAIVVAGWASSVPNPSWDNGFTINSDAASSGFMSSAYKIISSQSSVAAVVSVTGVARVGQGIVATYKTDSGIATNVHESTIKYSGSGSQKLVAATTTNGAFTQSVNVGDTNGYNMEAYVYTNGAAVTSADVNLVVDTTDISTTYESAGGGWYKLTGSVVGAATSVNYGLKVKAGKTVYVDAISLNKYVTSGTVTSNIYDTGKPSNWGNLSYTSNGTVQVKARSSNSATMSGAPSFGTCTSITSGADISSGTGGCVTDTQRYIQYEVTLTTAATQTTSELSDITFNFADTDTTAPSTNASALHMYASNGGSEITENNWTIGSSPYFTWTAGEDNVGGLGIKGYCLYLGQDGSADPLTAKGLLGTSPLDTEGTCPFAVSGTTLDLATLNYLASALSTSNTAYHLNVKAFDFSYNTISSSASFGFKFDNTPPTNPAYITAPSNFINTKTATLSWATSGGDAASDSNSGITGLQYKIGPSGTWYGDSHSGTQAASDLLANDGSYTTQSVPDFANLSDGNNVIYFRTWDSAGNISQANVTTVLKINTSGAPSSPRNITASPSTNTQNSFGFNWIAPATFVGQASNLTYCYTINTLPTEQTCSFTAAGVTSLPAAAFATQPGTNTFYIVAKDESGGVNYATAGSVDFIANTSAPGMPLNLDIADTSVKSSSNWRLVISWEQPTDAGAGVAKYQIFRSTDNINFALAGSTSGTSYVDTGLNSQLYYYKIKACDSANNCGAFSGTQSKTPTGRFTTAPEIDAVPKVESISTKKS